jgi:hypothetical protein
MAVYSANLRKTRKADHRRNTIARIVRAALLPAIFAPDRSECHRVARCRSAKLKLNPRRSLFSSRACRRSILCCSSSFTRPASNPHPKRGSPYAICSVHGRPRSASRRAQVSPSVHLNPVKPTARPRNPSSRVPRSTRWKRPCCGCANSTLLGFGTVTVTGAGSQWGGDCAVQSDHSWLS